MTFVAAAGVALTSACGNTAASAAQVHADSLRTDSIARARQDSINRAQPGYVIDSILPIDEEVRRFKTQIGGEPVESFSHASASREELVRRIVRDVAKADTVDMASSAITPREFIDLVYESSPYTHQPYREKPSIVWMQLANPSNNGFLRLIQRQGGQAYKYDSHTCDARPEHQGKNTLWLNCVVRVESPQHEIITQHWFGTIIERDGRYKILSFRNQY